MSMMIDCPVCEGLGSVDCPDCHGEGPDLYGTCIGMKPGCPTCQGFLVMCQTCEGDGEIDMESSDEDADGRAFLAALRGEG